MWEMTLVTREMDHGSWIGEEGGGAWKDCVLRDRGGEIGFFLSGGLGSASPEKAGDKKQQHTRTQGP